MDAIVDKRLVMSHFELHAGDYDRVTPVQAAMAGELLARIVAALHGTPPRNVLELGCGTGRLTRLLRQRFPAAAIASLDVAPAMVAAARAKLAGEPVRWLVGDAESPPAAILDGAPYDLVVSNAMIQWLHEPARLLADCRRLLAPGGCLAVSTFGSETFRELRDSFAAAERALGMPLRQHLMPLPTAAGLAAWLAAAGVEPRVTAEPERRAFPLVTDFLHGLKLTGATLARPDAVPVRRDLYRRLLAEYETRFPHEAGGIAVTYEKLHGVGRLPVT